MKRIYYKRNPKKFMKFEKQVENCKKVYLVYAGTTSFHFGEYPFAGKFAKDEQLGYSPLVYNFDDCNGTDFVYEVMPISEVTTFAPLVYTFDFYTAQRIVSVLNNEPEFTKGYSYWKEMVEKYYNVITDISKNGIEITDSKIKPKTNSRIIVNNKKIKGGK